MDHWSDKPSVASTLKLVFFGLALCVFLWGLQYKLSLYDPVQASSHQIPTAKLLSKDDLSSGLTAVLAATRTTPSDSALPSLLFTACLLTLLMRTAVGLPSWNVLSSRIQWRVRAEACLNAFYFRPPPISA